MFHQTALDRTVTPVYLDLIFILSKEPHNSHRNRSSAASPYSLGLPAWKIQEREIEQKLLLEKHLYPPYINLPSQCAYPVCGSPPTLLTVSSQFIPRHSKLYIRNKATDPVVLLNIIINIIIRTSISPSLCISQDTQYFGILGVLEILLVNFNLLYI